MSMQLVCIRLSYFLQPKWVIPYEKFRRVLIDQIILLAEVVTERGTVGIWTSLHKSNGLAIKPPGHKRRMRGNGPGCLPEYQWVPRWSAAWWCRCAGVGCARTPSSSTSCWAPWAPSPCSSPWPPCRRCSSPRPRTCADSATAGPTASSCRSARTSPANTSQLHHTTQSLTCCHRKTTAGL